VFIFFFFCIDLRGLKCSEVLTLSVFCLCLWKCKEVELGRSTGFLATKAFESEARYFFIGFIKNEVIGFQRLICFLLPKSLKSEVIFLLRLSKVEAICILRSLISAEPFKSKYSLILFLGRGWFKSIKLKSVIVLLWLFNICKYELTLIILDFARTSPCRVEFRLHREAFLLLFPVCLTVHQTFAANLDSQVSLARFGKWLQGKSANH
jgi:hypothetical protein